MAKLKEVLRKAWGLVKLVGVHCPSCERNHQAIVAIEQILLDHEERIKTLEAKDGKKKK